MAGHRGHRQLGRRAGILLAALALVLVAQPAAGLYTSQLRWGTQGSGDGQHQVPLGIAVDDAGSVYTIDAGNERVQKFTSAGQFVTKWGSSGTTDGLFLGPAGITVDKAGNVYVTDDTRDNVQKFSSGGVFLDVWGGSGTGPGELESPHGIAIDKAGNVYVADTNNDRIQKFSATGNYITEWPVGVVVIDVDVDQAGNVYTLDLANGELRKFTNSGTPIVDFGFEGVVAAPLGPMPFGMAIGPGGVISIADTTNHRIVQLTSEGVPQASWGLNGTGDENLLEPRDVDVDAAGNVFIADSQNHRIQRFRAALPETAIGGPSGLIRDSTPTFTLSSDADPATFQCRVKGSGVGYTTCTSPYTTPVLEDGLNVVLVRAVDAHALIDATPAEHDFRVDATLPQTWLDSGPGATTKDRTPTFAFSSSERGTFQCRVDGAAFKACTSPRTTGTLSLGTHTFRVRAVDRAGNRDATPAVRTFKVVP